MISFLVRMHAGLLQDDGLGDLLRAYTKSNGPKADSAGLLMVIFKIHVFLLGQNALEVPSTTSIQDLLCLRFSSGVVGVQYGSHIKRPGSS